MNAAAECDPTERQGSSIREAARGGRPSASKTQENVETISEMIGSKRRLTIRQISDDLSVSYGPVQNILTT